VVRGRRDENSAMAEFRRQREAEAQLVTPAPLHTTGAEESQAATPPTDVVPPMRVLRPLVPPAPSVASPTSPSVVPPTDESTLMPRTLVQPGEPRPSRLEELVEKLSTMRLPSAAFFAGTVAWTFLSLLVIETGAGVLGHGWHPGILVPGSLVMLAGGWVLLHLSTNQSRRRRRAACLLAGLVLAVAGVGMANSVVINGRVVASTSTTAAVYHAAQNYESDFLLLKQAEKVANYSPADLQANINSLQPLIDQLSNMNSDVAAAAPPDKNLWAVQQDLKTASYYAGQAMSAELQLANTPDASLAAQLSTQISSAVLSMQAARGRAFYELGQVTAKYGFSLPGSVN